ncbi:MAG: D-alanyl-D-alanine carboxypeptidase [Clostridia bacterium]|nr:D-alanyl-D-alanine carboxypeptidase [Clostridia bacterium]
MKKTNKKNKLVAILLICLIIILQSIQTFAAEELSINAKAGLIVETNTGKTIYEKEAEKQNYPASVTKILTAILVIENCKLDDVATASKTAISNIPEGYVVAPLYVGEEMKIEDLLYALMLKSANDAAYVLAEHVGGSVEGFSDMMNKKAQELGCKNSHFVNPNGIHNENHYTTAYDMYLISNYAMKNETFAKIVSTYKYTLPITNKYKSKDRVMENTNNFVNPNSKYYNENVKGIKTGTTIQAGNCLITDVSKDGLSFINVVLGANTSSGKFDETKKMIDYEIDNYTLTQVHKKGDKIQNIEVEKATNETKNLDLVISDDITTMNNKKITVDDMKPEIELNEEIVAPITKGQELGTIKYNVEDIEYSAKLLAANDVERTYIVEIMIAVGIVFGIIFILIIVKKIRRR